MSAVVAPQAPGAIGRGASPMENRKYLIELGEWLDNRRAQLDELDRAALQSKNADALTQDIALAMALWQSISVRYRRLLEIWDGGRVGPRQCDELANMIWGRLDEADNTAASGLSLPEACKLSDALCAQLYEKLGLGPNGTESIARITKLRASLERIRDQLGLARGDLAANSQARFKALEDRLQQAVERGNRGADTAGLFGPLENDAARLERDLIVGVSVGQGMQRQIRPGIDALQSGLNEILRQMTTTEAKSDQKLSELVVTLEKAIGDYRSWLDTSGWPQT